MYTGVKEKEEEGVVALIIFELQKFYSTRPLFAKNSILKVLESKTLNHKYTYTYTITKPRYISQKTNTNINKD